jgi:polyphosphate glucokinase
MGPEAGCYTRPMSDMNGHHLGIDIGGSGIKGAPVDTTSGELTAERFRLDTPQPAKVNRVVDVVAEVVAKFAHEGPIGITFPGVVSHGEVRTAANMHESWIGTDADSLFTGRFGRPVLMVNDADAAGVAEMKFGAGRGRDGVVVTITLGTGIGSAVFHDGKLLPNTELGHVELDGHDAETRASAAARDDHGLSWADYAGRVERYLNYIHFLLCPDLFIIGGGVSKKADKFLPHIELNTEIVPAAMLNDAGIVGAALSAPS